MIEQIAFVCVLLALLGFGSVAAIKPGFIQSLYASKGLDPDYYRSSRYRISVRVTGVALALFALIVLALVIASPGQAS